MTKAELITIVAERCEGASKAEVTKIHDTIFETIGEALAEEGRYAVSGFGTFEVRERPARQGRNPRTGEPMEIAASKNVGFKAASALKQNLNK